MRTFRRHAIVVFECENAYLTSPEGDNPEADIDFALFLTRDYCVQTIYLLGE